MHRLALFPLSGDPIHYGHLYVIEEASRTFEQVLVYVSENDEKMGSYLLDLPTRTAMVERAIRDRDLENVRVIGGTDLLVDVYLRENCDAIVRGVRDSRDKEYEIRMFQYHESILPGISEHLHFIDTGSTVAPISSTVVKVLASRHVDVSYMVPLCAKAALEEAMHSQFRLAVTGQMGVGKTTVIRQIMRAVCSKGLPVSYISFDDLVRRVYQEDTPGAQAVRDDIRDNIDQAAVSRDGKEVNREWIKEHASLEHLELLQKWTTPHVFRLLREELGKARGLVLIEWSQFAEEGLTQLCNHNVLVIHSSARDAFLEQRGVSDHVRFRFGQLQWDVNKCTKTLMDRAHRDHYGQVLCHNNLPGGDITGLMESIFEMFPTLRGVNIDRRRR